MRQNIYYVYEHRRADNDHVFYIGKGKGKRAFVQNRHHRSEWWHRIKNSAGGFSVRYVADGMSETDAFALEVAMIAMHRLRGSGICNISDGGDGVSGVKRNEEWLSKIGAAHRGKVISTETREKISISVKASGYRPDSAARQKISEAHRGHKRSLGYRHTEEWKAEASKRHKGKRHAAGYKYSPEQLEERRKRLSGIPQPVVECPFCKKRGGLPAMKRHHFENCKSL